MAQLVVDGVQVLEVVGAGAHSDPEVLRGQKKIKVVFAIAKS